MANPKQVKAIASARLKNDRVDANMLAHLLRTDLLPTVWIPPRAVRESRALLVHRHRLVRIRTQVKNALHALVANLSPPGNQSGSSVRAARPSWPRYRWRAAFSSRASTASP